MQLSARTYLAILGLAVLSACADGSDPLTQGTRSAAKGVVDDVVADRLPGTDVTPYTDCIIDNASALELLQISKAAVVGIDGEIVGQILTIAERKDTLLCFVKNGRIGGL